MSWISQSDKGVVLQIKVIPRGSVTRIEGVLGDALKIKLQAPPVDGKANKALVKFLAKKTGVPARQIELVSGETARNKRMLIRGAKMDLIMAEIGSV